MVIGFSVKEAREQLLNHGIVYTFRWTRRAFFRKGLGEKESTWANAKRTGKKIVDVWIEEIGKMDPTTSLIKYTSKSGFKDLRDWQEVICEMPHRQWSSGWLYKVTLKRSNGSETDGTN